MKKTMNISYTAFALFAFACFALSPQAGAVCQDGCDTSNENTFQGDDALINNTTGFNNTAVGSHALLTNTTGASNTAVGDSALLNNTIGTENTANGVLALASNTEGSGNTATGVNALSQNTTGFANTAVGLVALYSNTDGIGNTALGANTLVSNTEGNFNTGLGIGPLSHNTTGSSNTAVGGDALQFNTTGSGNVAVGQATLDLNAEGSSNTAIGTGALANSTGHTNTALGNSAGFNLTTGDNNIYIGSQGAATESNTIRIGDQGTQTNTFIAGIAGKAIARGRPVFINAQGKLGTHPSSARFKTDIKPMDKASEAILALKPVTFHYKKELDPDGVAQFGLVAEDVAKVNPDLVVADAAGEIYTVRYEAVNAMLLNEFLKEHRTVQAQQKEIDALRTELKEQRTLIQKVNDKVELNRSVPQMVLNNQ